MSTDKEAKMIEARERLFAAMHDMLNLSYEDEGIGNMYITDWVLCVAAESMQPGHSDKTFLINFARQGMATYQTTGLLGNALKRYENS